MGEKLRGEADYRFIAVEPASCPSLTRGKYVYDFCDTGKVCPLQKMYTLGSSFMPSANHAGGLRYHGMSSVLSELYDQGLMEAVSVEQTSVFAAAQQFARVEGILSAPESSHAIRVAIDEALRCKETGEEKNILFGLTGTDISICTLMPLSTTAKWATISPPTRKLLFLSAESEYRGLRVIL